MLRLQAKGPQDHKLHLQRVDQRLQEQDALTLPSPPLNPSGKLLVDSVRWVEALPTQLAGHSSFSGCSWWARREGRHNSREAQAICSNNPVKNGIALIILIFFASSILLTEAAVPRFIPVQLSWTISWGEIGNGLWSQTSWAVSLNGLNCGVTALDFEMWLFLFGCSLN